MTTNNVDPNLLAMSGMPGMMGAGAGMAIISTIASSGGSAQQASFSVEIDQIPGLIAKYEEAQRKLAAIQDKAMQLKDVTPPGDDEVSAKLAQSLGEMAGDGDGKLSWAVTQGIERLQGQIDQLKSAQSSYQGADEQATPSQA